MYEIAREGRKMERDACMKKSIWMMSDEIQGRDQT